MRWFSRISGLWTATQHVHLLWKQQRTTFRGVVVLGCQGIKAAGGYRWLSVSLQESYLRLITAAPRAAVSMGLFLAVQLRLLCIEAWILCRPRAVQLEVQTARSSPSE